MIVCCRVRPAAAACLRAAALAPSRELLAEAIHVFRRTD